MKMPSNPDRAGQPGLPLLETAAGVKASAGFLVAGAT